MARTAAPAYQTSYPEGTEGPEGASTGCGSGRDGHNAEDEDSRDELISDRASRYSKFFFAVTMDHLAWYSVVALIVHGIRDDGWKWLHLLHECGVPADEMDADAKDLANWSFLLRWATDAGINELLEAVYQCNRSCRGPRAYQGYPGAFLFIYALHLRASAKYRDLLCQAGRPIDPEAPIRWSPAAFEACGWSKEQLGADLSSWVDDILSDRCPGPLPPTPPHLTARRAGLWIAAHIHAELTGECRIPPAKDDLYISELCPCWAFDKPLLCYVWGEVWTRAAPAQFRLTDARALYKQYELQHGWGKLVLKPGDHVGESDGSAAWPWAHDPITDAPCLHPPAPYLATLGAEANGASGASGGPGVAGPADPIPLTPAAAWRHSIASRRVGKGVPVARRAVQEDVQRNRALRQPGAGAGPGGVGGTLQDGSQAWSPRDGDDSAAPGGDWRAAAAAADRRRSRSRSPVGPYRDERRARSRSRSGDRGREERGDRARERSPHHPRRYYRDERRARSRSRGRSEERDGRGDRAGEPAYTGHPRHQPAQPVPRGRTGPSGGQYAGRGHPDAGPCRR